MASTLADDYIRDRRGTTGTIHAKLSESGRLLIVTVDGDVVSTNGVRRMQVVDANGTNTIEVSPAEPGAPNVRRFRVRKPAVNIDTSGAVGS